jgi:hypothetical protein
MVEGWEPAHAVAAIKRVRAAAVPSWEALQGCREDLLAKQEAKIAARAYALYRQGAPGNAQRHWFLAQQQVLRQWFLDAADDGGEGQVAIEAASRSKSGDK